MENSYSRPSKPLSAIAGHICWSCSLPRKPTPGRRGIPENPAKSEAVELQVCSGCHRVKYCSSECQKGDWREHKRLCKAFQLVNTIVESEPSEHRQEFAQDVLQDSFWTKLQRNRITVFRQTYGHDAVDHDRPLLYSPKCFHCLRSPFQVHPNGDKVKLVPCTGCRIVFACVGHWPALTDSGKHVSHSERCHEWEDMAYLELVRRDYIVKSRELDCLMQHAGINSRFPGLPAGPTPWADYFTWRHNEMASMLGTLTTAENDDYLNHPGEMLDRPQLNVPRMLLAASTESASMVLTVLAALQQTHGIEEMNRMTSVTLHIVGADGTEMISSSIYEEILHILPRVKEVFILLIGPDADAGSERAILLDCCDKCRQAGRQRTLQAIASTYDAYTARKGYHKPDLIVGFNTGMSEVDTRLWAPSVKAMISVDIPVALTSFNEEEAVGDRTFVEGLGADILVREERNKWGSRVSVPEPEKVGELYRRNAWWFMFKGRRAA